MMGPSSVVLLLSLLLSVMMSLAGALGVRVAGDGQHTLAGQLSEERRSGVYSAAGKRTVLLVDHHLNIPSRNIPQVRRRLGFALGKNNKKKHKRKKGYDSGDHGRDTPKRRKGDEGLLGAFSLSNLNYGDIVAYSLIIAGGIYLYGKFIKDK
jgi:hypothetical protein